MNSRHRTNKSDRKRNARNIRRNNILLRRFYESLIERYTKHPIIKDIALMAGRPFSHLSGDDHRRSDDPLESGDTAKGEDKS